MNQKQATIPLPGGAPATLSIPEGEAQPQPGRDPGAIEYDSWRDAGAIEYDSWRAA